MDTKKYIIMYYDYLFTIEELKKLNDENIREYLKVIWDDTLNGNEYKVISWFKKDTIGDMPIVVSASLTDMNNIKTFCNSLYGIEYIFPYSAILGGTNGDAATLIEPIERTNEFTIGTIKGKAINSYNRATPIITPIQLLENNDSYNEIVLDSSKLIPKSVVYLDDIVLEEVDHLSAYLNVRINKIRNKVLTKRQD